MHEAEQYLRNPETPYSLYIQYQGRRRRLFYNRDQNICGIIGIGRRRYGFGFGDWDNIEKIFKPAPDKDPEEINRRLIRKFQREAAKAGFTSPFIRKIQHADYSKDLYKNGITTGTSIDGQIITLEAVRNGAAKRLTGLSARPSKTARRSIRVGLISAATTVRYGWNLAIRTMAITGLGT